MKFAFVAVEKASFSVSVLCKFLGVSRSGFYAWTERVPSARSFVDAKLRVHVRLEPRAARRRERSRRKFEVDAPNVAWVTDITYVWTSEGWLDLAAILDLFSRRVVGFAMSERIDRALALEALAAAVGRRVRNAGLVHHSDRGSQYACNDYQTALDDLGVVCRRSRKGNCWDNAVAESFFAT